MSSIPVYLVKKDCPAPYLVGIHNAIKLVNQIGHGRNNKHAKVWFEELKKTDGKGLYDAVVFFESYSLTDQFAKEAAKLNCLEAMEYHYPDYVSTSDHLEMDENGRVELWHPYADSMVHFTGDDVCKLPWNLREYATPGMHIEEIIFVGSNKLVTDAVRRYKYAVREIRESGFYGFGVNGKVRLGLTGELWKRIAAGLGHRATIYLITSDKTIIKVKRSGMSWVLPQKKQPRSFYSKMRLNRYKRIQLPTLAREYSALGTECFDPFLQSVVTMGLTHQAEVVRR